MYQCGTQFLAHLNLLQASVAAAEVMPHTQANLVGMLVRLDAHPAPVFCDRRDGSPAVQVATEQAGQAAAIDLDAVEPDAYLWGYRCGLTDHQ